MLRRDFVGAPREPVLITEQGEPILVIRSLLEDDLADELITQHPDFQASIARARAQKARGETRSLEDLRRQRVTAAHDQG